MIVRKMTIIFWSDATKFSLFRGRKKRRKNRQKQGGAVRRAGGWKCGAGGVRIATPACALVRNDMLQGSAAHIGRRSVVTPPYGCGTWGAVHAGRRGRRPPTRRMVVGAMHSERCGHRPLRIFCRDSKKCGALTGAAGVG